MISAHRSPVLHFGCPGGQGKDNSLQPIIKNKLLIGHSTNIAKILSVVHVRFKVVNNVCNILLQLNTLKGIVHLKTMLPVLIASSRWSHLAHPWARANVQWLREQQTFRLKHGVNDAFSNFIWMSDTCWHLDDIIGAVWRHFMLFFLLFF